MRIIIAAPPKAGNMWLKCLLGTIYDLRWLKPREQPRRPETRFFREWVAKDAFPDGTIYHQHYDYDPAICDIAEAIPAHLVTIVRNPYDAFVSTYHTLQQHDAEENQKKRKTLALMGKPLDDPEIVAFLRGGGYRKNLLRARDWMACGRAHVARYENLHADPVAELTKLTEAIAPVPTETIERAIAECSAERMRQRSKGMAKHVRTARPGDARQQLGEEHYAAFRESHGEIIRELGYEVR